MWKVQTIVQPDHAGWEISIYDTKKPHVKMWGWFDANKLPYSVVDWSMTKHLLPSARRELVAAIQKGAKNLAAKMNRIDKANRLAAAEPVECVKRTS